MWIIVHFYQTGDEIVVQTQNICAVYPDQRKQYKGATVIQLPERKKISYQSEIQWMR